MTEPGRAEPPLARVLGPVRIPDRSGDLVPPPGTLPTRLVVALALAGPDGRSVEGLIEDLWPEDPPRNPRGALQMLVSRTRATAADGLLVSSPTGYRLTASDLAVAERAARAVDADVDAALGLWTGEPGSDVGDTGLADELAARAGRARSHLLTARATARLRSDPVAALADLDELTEGRPFHPEPVRLRMQALAAAGRTSEALAAFAAHRAALADELGTDPDPSLIALNSELLRAPGGPVEVLGVRAGPTRLLGRDPDIARLTAGVPEHRLTSIVGAGGLGKTRLAHAIATALAPRFGRVLFVELAGARAEADVELVIGAAVGARVAQARRRLSDPPPPDLRTRIREAVSARRTLLVLDNCEQVIETVAALTADLLATVPSLTVLTTTRVPLLLPGEWIHSLQPLDPTTDAAALFRERATAARADVLLGEGLVERICQRLDGSPLAIELAAARLRSMTLDELEQRLADRFAVLVGGDRSAPARHRTLFAVIDWSWQLLTPRSRDALRMLAVFPDGFTADAASTLLGTDATDVLSDLVDQSLLTFSERAGRGRYRMLETVREFGLRALDEVGGTEKAEAGLDRFALRFSRAAAVGLTGGADPASIRATATEEETLLSVLRRPSAGREPVVLAVFALLAEFWIYQGEFERLPEQLPAAAEAGAHRPGSEEETHEALRALTLAAGVGSITGAPGALRATAHLRRLQRALPAGAGDFWPTLATAVTTPIPPDQALTTLERLSATATDPLLATFASLILGQLYENSGRTTDALDAVSRSQRLAARHGLTWFRLVATLSIAQLHSQRAQRDDALRFATAALEEIAALDVRTDLGQLEWTVAVSELALGRLEEAEARFRRLLAKDPGRTGSDRSDDRSSALAGLAEVAAARGDQDAAVETWAAAVGTADRASRPWRLIVGASALAAAAQRTETQDAALVVPYRRLRGRLLALARLPRPQLDVPVFATGSIALAAVLLRPERSERQRALGAELVVRSVPLGARLDLPTFEAVPGVREALAATGGSPPNGDTIELVVAVLRDGAARL